MEAHARRSPAVYARHHGKRLPNSVFERQFDPFDPVEVSTIPFVASIISAVGGGGGSESTAQVDASPTQSFTNADLPLHTSLHPVQTSTDDDQTTATPTTSSSTPTSTSSTAVVTTTSTSAPVISFPTSASGTTEVIPASTATHTAGSDANVSGAATKSKGVPGVAIGIIVTLVVLAVMAWAIFFMRRKFISRREKKRATWGAGLFPKYTEFNPSAMVEKTHSGADNASIRSAPITLPGDASPFGAYGAAMNEKQAPTFDLTPPPMSYNSVAPPSALPPSLTPGSAATAAVSMSRATAASPGEAIVRCTFIPTLPDELSITTGESVTVIADYDDGWALCSNANGERGMVPLECLDRAARDSMFRSQLDFRTSRRVSSLPTPNY